MTTPTIFALATASGRAGVAVIRVSGPAAASALKRLTQMTDMPTPRLARLLTLQAPQSGQMIDRALVLWFPKPHSFTGEDVVELHIHGGRSVIADLSEVLSGCDGVRPAEAGEFTRRAVHNGKMDLTAAEGLIDLIDAETAAQRRQALRQMDGALGHLYEGWRSDLLKAQALIEADIDFADEGDVSDDVAVGARDIIDKIHAAIRSHLNDARRGERLRDGLHVAIIGAPNAGKSSLLNAVAERDVAIVSDIAGTTRDVLEVHLDLSGYPITLMDTAGLRDNADVVEAEGIRRAKARAETADIRLAMFDGSASRPDQATLQMITPETIVLINKSDKATPKWGAAALPPHASCHLISVQIGDGLSEVLTQLGRVADGILQVDEAPVLTRARHRSALEVAREALDAAGQAVDNHMELALIAEHVRFAARSIGRITGRVDVEDLLDVVFRDFCIGK